MDHIDHEPGYVEPGCDRCRRQMEIMRAIGADPLHVEADEPELAKGDLALLWLGIALAIAAVATLAWMILR